MVFDQIERLKQQYTDKFVVVDANRPELRRFAGMTGTVRTVNMSGRALVEFDANNNIGWFDIDLGSLKVIDQPLAKPEKPEAKKPEKAPATPKAAPAPKPESAPAAGAKTGQSVADILAAARGKSAPAKPASAEAAPIAAAAPAKAAADPKKMSMAEILAAARGKPTAPTASVPAAPAAKAPAPVTPPPAAAPVVEAPAPPVAAAPLAKPVAAAPASGKLSKAAQITSVADQVAYCRATDAK